MLVASVPQLLLPPEASPTLAAPPAGSAGSAGGAGGAGGGGGGAALVPLGQPDMFRMVMGVAMVATGAIMLFITILTPII
jgi:hypothetical protein